MASVGRWASYISVVYHIITGGLYVLFFNTCSKIFLNPLQFVFKEHGGLTSLVD